MRELLVAFAVVLAACGGGESADTVDDDSASTTTTETPAAPGDSQAPSTQPPESEAPSEEPAAGASGIKLTIGEETWEFDSAFCAFVGADPGEEGSEWNVSNVKDGVQVYVSEDSYGILVQMADIANGGNPTFNWEAGGDAIALSVDGNDITATGDFTETVSDSGPTEGTLVATCPSWVSG